MQLLGDYISLFLSVRQTAGRTFVVAKSLNGKGTRTIVFFITLIVYRLLLNKYLLPHLLKNQK